MSRRPSGISRSDHIRHFKTCGVKPFDRFIVLIQNLMFAVGVQTAVGAEEVGFQLDGIKFLGVQRTKIGLFFVILTVMTDLTSLVVLFHSFLKVGLRNSEFFGKLSNGISGLKSIALNSDCIINLFLQIRQFLTDRYQYADAGVHAFFHHVLDLAVVKN